MKPLLNRFDAADEYFFVEGCFINELSNDEQDPQASVAQARVEPGKTTRWHRLEGIVERYVVLQGTGRVEVECMTPAVLQVGDVVTIPAGAAQRIHNCGNDDLVFLAICTPRFSAQAYSDVEDDVQIAGSSRPDSGDDRTV